MAKQKQIPKRSEVEKQYTWATEDIFASDALWEEELERAKAIPEKVASFRGTLGSSADNLYAYLQYYDEVYVIIEKLANYAMRKSDEDTGNSFYQNMKGKIMNLYVAVESADSFSTPEIIAIPDETLESFYNAKPELKLYTRKLSKIRHFKAHTLSDSEERLLALSGQVGSAPGETASAFRNADIKFPSIKDAEGNELTVTQGSYIPLMESPDRNVRKAAFESLYHTFESFKNTSAAFLDSQVKYLIFNARARNYESTLHAALDATEVPVSVYHNLIDAVHNNIDYLHKYIDLRKKLMGLDELHMYDVLRADRCISVNSLEARVPFGDLDFVKYVMSIDPQKKINTYGKGKYLLRHAFEEGGYLPEEILWREKAAFSDAVGHSMVDYLKEYAETKYSDEAFEEGCKKYDFARPFTKESLLYRDIFEKYYPGQAQMVVDFWMPNKSWEGCNVNDPSARVLSNYGDSGK